MIHYFKKMKTTAEVVKEYRKLSKQFHPDAGGTSEQMQQLTQQRDEAIRRIMKKSGASDSDVADWMNKSDLDKMEDFANQAMKNGKISMGFLSGLADKLADELVLQSEKTGKPITMGDGVKAAFSYVFGNKNIEADEPDSLNPGQVPEHQDNQEDEKQNTDNNG